MCRVRLLAFSGCHKLALGSLVPPRKWSQKADVAKQWAFILTEKTAIVSVKHTQCTVKGCIEIRKLIHLAKNISLSSNKHHHYFLFFIPPLISVTDLFGLQTQLLCVCERASECVSPKVNASGNYSNHKNKQLLLSPESPSECKLLY